MAALDNVNKRQFFHGTPHEFKPGDTVEPSMGQTGDPGHVYMTTHPYIAQSYARNRSIESTAGLGDGHVYRVENTGPYEKDYEKWSYKSTSPLRVVGEA